MSKAISEQSTETGVTARDGTGMFHVWFVASALVTIVANLALRESASWHMGVRSLLVLVPAVPLIGLIVSGLRTLRRMDEMERRIQLETLGMAFGALSLLLVLYGQTQTAFRFTPEPWTIVWPVMIVIYIECFTLVRRRYQ